LDLRENTKLRNPNATAVIARGDYYSEGRAGASRYDLCYLVTAWVRKIEDEHQLLWRVLAALMPGSAAWPRIGQSAQCAYQPFNIPLKVANSRLSDEHYRSVECC